MSSKDDNKNDKKLMLSKDDNENDKTLKADSNALDNF